MNETILYIANFFLKSTNLSGKIASAKRTMERGSAVEMNSRNQIELEKSFFSKGDIFNRLFLLFKALFANSTIDWGVCCEVRPMHLNSLTIDIQAQTIVLNRCNIKKSLEETDHGSICWFLTIIVLLKSIEIHFA